MNDSNQPHRPAATARRRRALAKEIGDGVAVVVAAPRQREVNSRYRPNPNLAYLAGMTEPDSALVLVARRGQVAEATLYCRARQKQVERWEGRIMGPAAAARRLDLPTKAWPGMHELLARSLPGHRRAFLEFGAHLRSTDPLTVLADKARDRPTSVHDLQAVLARLRVVKDRQEIAALKRAARVTTDAIHNVCMALDHATHEHEVGAALSEAYEFAGGHHAFLPIVACGANACVAHYVTNTGPLRHGRLLLVDSGCELDGYTSDMTRVFPVDGTFTPAQRDLLDIVVAAQAAALAKVKPGNTMTNANDAARRELARGLVSLRICKGSVSKVLSSGALDEHYFHSIGHLLGLDVHDPLDDPSGTPPRLQARMAVTIEPGLYLGGMQAVPAELRHTGVRIEDTVIVTKAGHDNLTDRAPKDADLIEAMLAG